MMVTFFGDRRQLLSRADNRYFSVELWRCIWGVSNAAPTAARFSPAKLRFIFPDSMAFITNCVGFS